MWPRRTTQRRSSERCMPRHVMVNNPIDKRTIVHSSHTAFEKNEVDLRLLNDLYKTKTAACRIHTV